MRHPRRIAFAQARRKSSTAGDGSHARLSFPAGPFLHMMPAMTKTKDYHLVYFGDPMCSWCYGFAPVITTLADHFGDRLPVDVVMGGLRAGNTQAMRQKDKDYIRDAWTRVNQASGQPFDFAFLDREGFVYDTEPACRAVVTVRTLAPRIALRFKESVSRAFYAEGRDTTDAAVLTEIAAQAGIEPATFEPAFASAEVRNETVRDFMTAQQLGVQGFPTLIAGSRRTREYAVVTNGYCPIDGLPEALERWLAGKEALGASTH